MPDNFAPTDLQPGSMNLFGPRARFHHVGIVVASIPETAPDLKIAADPVQDVKVAFAELHGTMIELIEPASDASPVTRSLDNGIKLAHLCFSVPDITTAIATGETNDLRLIADPVPATAFSGRLIAWMYHPVLGLFELVERPTVRDDASDFDGNAANQSV